MKKITNQLKGDHLEVLVLGLPLTRQSTNIAVMNVGKHEFVKIVKMLKTRSKIKNLKKIASFFAYLVGKFFRESCWERASSLCGSLTFGRSTRKEEREEVFTIRKY